jgi:ABC-type cobalamin/Fe3+-siderophores transport system ATPase subunit
MSCDLQLEALERDLRSVLDTSVKDFVAMARTRLEGAFEEVTKERAKGFADLAARRSELGREMAAMQQHQEAQEGRVELELPYVGRRCDASRTPSLTPT